MMRRFAIHKKLRNIAQLITPHLKVGGVEISNSFLAYAYIDPVTGAVQKTSVRLQGGIIEDGILKNPEGFRAALRELHAGITHKKKEQLPVILSISDGNTYTQRFMLPPLPKSEFNEAIKLNLQTISPIEFSKAYADWERMPAEEDAVEWEILASFAEKQVIDPIVSEFRNENFFITAIEQKSVSLVRTVTHFEKSFDPGKSYLLLTANPEGISFIIIRQGNAYFTRYTPWKSVLEGSASGMSEQDLKNFIVRDVNQIQNFFSNMCHESFEAVYVVTGSMTKIVTKVLGEEFQFPVRIVRLEQILADEQWFVTLGAALRGMMPLSKDMQISLAPEGTESLYRNMQISVFLSWWTAIFSITAFIILGSFLGSFIFLNSHIEETAQVVGSSFNDPRVFSQYEFYTTEARKFNAAVAQVASLKEKGIRWGNFLSDLYQKAEAVRIERVYVQAPEMPITINGRARNEQEANLFKSRLSQLPYVSEIELPLSSFQKNDDSTVSFRIALRLKNLNF